MAKSATLVCASVAHVPWGRAEYRSRDSRRNSVFSEAAEIDAENAIDDVVAKPCGRVLLEIHGSARAGTP